MIGNISHGKMLAIKLQVNINVKNDLALNNCNIMTLIKISKYLQAAAKAFHERYI